MSRFDVIIVGGGPAGAATALALAHRGVRALLLERSHYEVWRVGEFLWPWAQKYLEQLDVWDRFCSGGHLPSHAIYSAWGTQELAVNHFIFNPYGKGWHLDRKRFDAMLANAAEETGARVLRGSRVVSCSRFNDQWRIVVEQGENSFEATTPILVDATGRACWLARACGTRWTRYDRQISIVRILKAECPGFLPSDVLMLEAAQDGWWYSGPLPDRSLIVAYFTDSDYLRASDANLERFWCARLKQTTHTIAATQAYVPEGKLHVRPASSGRLDRAAGPGWLAVGDAACVFDPLTGSGIPKALQNALAAAAAICECAEDRPTTFRDYAQQMIAVFEAYLEQRIAYYQMEPRWPNSIFWRRRNGSQRYRPAESERAGDETIVANNLHGQIRDFRGYETHSEE